MFALDAKMARSAARRGPWTPIVGEEDVAQKNQDTEPGKSGTPKRKAASQKEAAPKKEAIPKTEAVPNEGTAAKPTRSKKPAATPADQVAAPVKPAVAPAERVVAPAEPVLAPAEPKPAPTEPFEESPVHRKLGLRPGAVGLVVAPPVDDDNPLLPLPDGFSVLPDADAVSSFEGQVDYLHFFARNRGELARVFSSLRDKLAPGGSLWISWIKQSSSRRGEGLPGDLNENVIRRLALTSGLVDVKVAALDHDWSALRLVHRKH